MKIKLKIKQQKNYRQNTTHSNVTSFLITHEHKKKWRDFRGDGNNGSLNHRGEIDISCNRVGYKGTDKEYGGLSKCIENLIFNDSYGIIGGKTWKYYNDSYEGNFSTIITFKYPDGNVMISISKQRTIYFNGVPTTKVLLLSTLSRLFYRTCFTRSALILRKYLRMLSTTPPNVKYALENRTPYHFFEADKNNSYRSTKLQVLINTQRISSTECALEISENIWFPIKIKELDRFLKIFRHNKRTSKKWLDISPAGLWETLSNEKPSESQILVMKAWLRQNRTDKMVEDRAKQLMLEIDRENEEIINFNMEVDGKERCAMYVKGQVADWILIENNAAKTSRQRVSIYCYHEQIPSSLENRDVSKIISASNFLSGKLRGPICVDNSVGQVSLGDQFASRAFSLMNDRFSLSLISTLASALPKNGMQNRLNSSHLNKYRGALK